MPIFAHHDATGKIVGFVMSASGARLVPKAGAYVTEIPELSAGEKQPSIEELREIARTRIVSPSFPQGRLIEKT